MKQNISLLCVTGNTDKFGLGKKAFAKHDIELIQLAQDIDEIQGEDPQIIVRDKATKAFALVQKPLLVTDDSWSIPALNGFPGPYMKSVNHWFAPEDFIALMKGKTDRRIFLHQYIAYIDELETVIFEKTIPGLIPQKPRGSYGPPVMKIAILNKDSGLTISEIFDNGGRSPHGDGVDAWDDVATWYAKKVTL